MRLVYLTKDYLPSNTTPAYQTVATASGLGAAGVEVFLFPPAERGPLATAETVAAHYAVEPAFRLRPIVNAKARPPGFERFGKTLHVMRSLIEARSAGADAVYARTPELAIAAVAGAGLPVFFETFEPWPSKSPNMHRLFRFLEKRRRLAGLILHSAYVAKSFAGAGFGSERILVAHNASDPRLFAGAPPRSEARRLLGLEAETRPLVVYTGNVRARKGVDYILDTAERMPGFAFAIVGARREGPIQSRAANLANVSVHPWQNRDGLAAWLAAADILVVPPTRMPFDNGYSVLPIKVFDYLAAGRAIVAPSTEDVTEVLTDGVNALLVPPDDPGAFAAALRRLAADAGLREALEKGARESAQANDWQARGERIQHFIAARLGHRDAASPFRAAPRILGRSKGAPDVSSVARRDTDATGADRSQGHVQAASAALPPREPV